MRACGVLLPVSSLPSPYGIGCFSKEAYEFVDQLVQAGQTYWQILPLGPTGYGDSPYQSFSAFAGNPYFIDLDTLAKEGLLQPEEYQGLDFGGDAGRIDYAKLYQTRFPVLELAFSRADLENDAKFRKFCEEQAHWLEDYSLYMAIKHHFGEKSWDKWEEDIRLGKPEAVSYYKQICRQEILFFKFLQYQFTKQWEALKAYANGRGIRIIGDIPIYVAFDSADSWQIPRCSSTMKSGGLLWWQAVRRMLSLQTDSCGAILCTTGNTMRRRDMPGGSGGWSTALSCTMWCASIISAALTNTMRSRTETLRPQGEAGKRALV